MAREKLGRNACSALLIVDAQSVKNTDTAALKGHDAEEGISKLKSWTPMNRLKPTSALALRPAHIK